MRLSLVFISSSFFFEFSFTEKIQSRQAANCTNIDSPPHPSCWDTLGVSSWLSQWANQHRNCTGSNIAQLSEANNSWAACFLHSFDTGTISQANARNLSDLDSILAVSLDDEDALNHLTPQDHVRYTYVIHALSSIKQLYAAWNRIAMPSSNGSSVNAIFRLLSPDQQTKLALQDVYQSLLIGLAFLLGPAISIVPLGLFPGNITGLLLELLHVATINPGLEMSVLSNNSGRPEQTVSLSYLTSNASLLDQTVTSVIQSGLHAVMTNLDTFLNITAYGTFSSPRQIMLPENSSYLQQPFLTYLISTILSHNGWTLLALPGIDPVALSQSISGTLPQWVLSNCPSCNLPIDLGCSSYDEYNQCGRWWYSEDLNSNFTLVQENNTHTDPTNLLTTIFEQGWTSGELLFENAAICDEPPSLVNIITEVPKWSRPASSVTDYMDSWFWHLLEIAPRNGTAQVDIVVSKYLNQYIESRPGPVSHPPDTLFKISGGKVDLSCVSQLNLQMAWNFTAIMAGEL